MKKFLRIKRANLHRLNSVQDKNSRIGVINMPKDSQVDNKLSRKLKSNWDDTSASEEGKNKNKTRKKQSAPVTWQ
ncbi:hypothetical protein D3C81_1809720 [compost metagenome]|mgnify:CR=1 FL=1|jgi:hypothetical protein